MFKSRSRPLRLAPRQAARVVFGVVLIIGAARMVVLSRAADGGPVDGAVMAALLGRSWLEAVAAALVIYLVLRWLPAISERDHLRHASFVVPAVGVALVLPLSLHLLWMLVVDGSPAEFGDWVGLSIMFTGLSHVVFATLAAVRASQLARGKRPLSIGVIYGLSVGAATFPFPWLPPLLVAITGLPILPLLWLMKPLAARERATNDAELPIAIIEDR